ncbi:MAG: 16S rRNA (guanine(527)-N(7))-methyltransferase RsmG [Reyranellaceae bacterium]
MQDRSDPPRPVSRETSGRDADAFRKAAAALGVGVSRETLERLAVYVALLVRWQKRINLIGGSTVAEIWNRHVLDSAQLAPLLPPGPCLLTDLGSGAGFPGLVIAALRPDITVRLVEADARKAAFLMQAAREMRLPQSPTVTVARIESIPPIGADVVTARALAPLPQLLAWADRHRSPTGFCLFHKGKGWRSELTEAMKTGDIAYDVFPSVTDRDAVLLRLPAAPPADFRDRQPEGRRRQDDDGD